MSISMPFEPVTSLDSSRITEEAKRIKGVIQRLGLLKIPVELSHTYYEDQNALVVTYFMEDENKNYCKAVYSLDEDRGDVLSVTISYVTSSLKFGTGTFLLYLQLLLAYRVHAAYVQLDNSAGSTPNNAVRALNGIYRWFSFNTRTVSPSNLQLFHNLQANQTLSNHTRKSRILQEVAGGSLYFDMSQFSYVTWVSHLMSLRTEEENPQSPWRSGVKERFQSIVDHIIRVASPKQQMNRNQRRTRRLSHSPYSRKGGKRTKKKSNKNK